MRKIEYLFSLVMLLVLCACGDTSKATIEGKITGADITEVRVIYCADDKVNYLTESLKKGKFEFEIKLKEPAVIEFYTPEKLFFGRIYVEAGDNIECKFNLAEPNKSEVTGNEVSERWIKFLRENSAVIDSGDSKEINAVVAQYINNNKADVLSTLLLMSQYITMENSVEAMKLLSSIAPEARPQSLVAGYEAMLERENNVKTNDNVHFISYFSRNDTTATLSSRNASYTLLAFSDDFSRNKDNIAMRLKELSEKYDKNRLQILEISLDSDTVLWKKSIKKDSADWQQGWVVGAAASPYIERLGIYRLPFYIVADSTGRQLYRGVSIKDIETEVTKQLN